MGDMQRFEKDLLKLARKTNKAWRGRIKKLVAESRAASRSTEVGVTVLTSTLYFLATKVAIGEFLSAWIAEAQARTDVHLGVLESLNGALLHEAVPIAPEEKAEVDDYLQSLQDIGDRDVADRCRLLLVVLRGLRELHSTWNARLRRKNLTDIAKDVLEEGAEAAVDGFGFGAVRRLFRGRGWLAEQAAEFHEEHKDYALDCDGWMRSIAMLIELFGRTPESWREGAEPTPAEEQAASSRTERWTEEARAQIERGFGADADDANEAN